ncbi:sensor histidine kinase [Andreprevotia chitinilytica]|uniref:sensor histidine kinase n=1 Tax=Andreprevotia chitinilytica TaxID=396808 RepID=UPI0005560B35|nr:ATP-binding protein [Andreprevotia chitinilytica]
MRPKHESVPQPDFQLLFESAPGLYLVLAPDLTIAGASNAYLQASRLQRADILGCDLFALFDGVDGPDQAEPVQAALQASLAQVLQTRAPNIMAVNEYAVCRPEPTDGGSPPAQWRQCNVPVLGADGEVTYIIHQIERVAGVAQVGAPEAGKPAKEVEPSKEIEHFAYAISHDLRAPLRAIDGFAHLLSDRARDRLDNEDQRLLGVVRENCTKMGMLMDELVDFSRVTRVKLHRSRIDMAALVGAAWAQEGVNYNGQIVINRLPATSGDYGLLHQVWVNLLSNAAKYTAHQPEPRIEVSGETIDGECRYRVSDNGAGFDMRYAGKLFMLFQRLHNSDEFHGSGVGLAMVASIVGRHGGRVWAEGEVGKGASFYFALPEQEAA